MQFNTIQSYFYSAFNDVHCHQAALQNQYISVIEKNENPLKDLKYLKYP